MFTTSSLQARIHQTLRLKDAPSSKANGSRPARYTFILPAALMLATGCLGDANEDGWIDTETVASEASNVIHPSEIVHDQQKPPSEQKLSAGASCQELCEDELDVASDACASSENEASCLKQAAYDYNDCSEGCNEDYPTPYFSGSGK